MAKKLFVSVAISLYFLQFINPTISFLIKNGNNDFNVYSSRHLPNNFNNISSEFEHKLLFKAITPIYLQELFTLAEKTSSSKTTANDYRDFIKSLVYGVTSESCKGHVAEWWWRWGSDNIINIGSDKEKWVLQMLDAWGKLPEGILAGHVNSYGDVDECIQVEVNGLEILNNIYSERNIAKSFEGQYCTVYLADKNTALGLTPQPTGDHLEERANVVPKKAVSIEELLKMLGHRQGMVALIPSVGVCMPNSCSQQDVQRILVNGMKMVYSNMSLDPQFPWPMVAYCSDIHNKSLDGAAIIVIVLVSTLFLLALTAGIVDYWFCHTKKENEIASSPKTTAYKYLMAFSLYTNIKKWLSTKRGADNLGCLHGIRFLSTAWVVLCHEYSQYVQGPQWNQIDIAHIHEDWTMLAVINGTFAVDTFFLMSGMLAAYSILKMLDKSGGKFNIIMFYVHRYLRLTPLYAILIGMTATLTSYVGRSRHSYVNDMIEEVCRKNWWTNLLYINNMVKVNEPCNGQTWYLANDMQFYILSPFIVYPIWKWKKIGLLLLTVYSILSCVSRVLVVRYAEDVPPAIALTGNIGANIEQIYYRPWNRIGPFLVGIWLGWLLHATRGKRIQLTPPFVLGLWFCSTGIAFAVLFGIYPWFSPANTIPEVSGYFYAGLSRFSWGVAVALVIFLCAKGYGGIFNTFLSWKVYIPLGRLTFCVYLTSIHIQYIFFTRLPVPIKADTFTMVNLFLAHLLLSNLVAFVCTMIFESPFMMLQKQIFETIGSNHNALKNCKLESTTETVSYIGEKMNGHSKNMEKNDKECIAGYP